MAEFVLDASVALSWCFPGDPTEDTPYCRLILAKLAKDDAVVPDIWAFHGPYLAGTKANPSTIGPSRSVPWPAATIPK